MIKEQMKAELHIGIVEVIFTKADGSTRTMHCTLRNNLISESKESTKQAAPEPDHLIRVFDIEANGWRSFVVDRVQCFNGKKLN